MAVEIEFLLRDHQQDINDNWERWNAVVMHRRAGKSWFCVGKLVEQAANAAVGDLRLYYIGPSFKQAKAIAWDYLCSFCPPQTGCVANISELRMDFPNGSRIQMLGVENVDSLRGRYADGVIMDESQLMPSSCWTYVIRPMLADRKGWAFITGTPAGRHNLLGKAWEWGSDDGWQRRMFKHSDTTALDKDELKEMRKQMSQEAWSQEMECSFEAALQGAYYARQMEAAEPRITKVSYDPAMPVYVALDLGMSDAMACWYFQLNGNTIQCFNYEEHTGTSLIDLANHWRTKSHPIDSALLPHDARVRDLGTGLTRKEQLERQGVRCSVVKNIPIHDGIEAVRTTLPRVWFDRESCRQGIEALRAYRAEYDETRQVQKMQPLHDWASHGADAMRYLAVGHGDVASNWAPLDYSEIERRAI